MTARRTDRGTFSTPYSFEPLDGVRLDVTESSNGAPLPSAGAQILVTNIGEVVAHVVFGVDSAVATTARLAIMPMTSVIVTRPQANVEDQSTMANYVAAITASGTTTLQIETGAGF